MKDRQSFKAARRILRPDQKGSHRAPGRHANPLAGRGSGLLLAVLPIFLVPALMWKFLTLRIDQALVLVLAMVALGMAAALVRRGQILHAAYDEAVMAKAPPWPVKGLAYALIALAVGGSLALASPATLATAVVLGVLAGGCALAAYGLDPLSDKSPARQSGEADSAHDARVWQHIEAAEHKIVTLRDRARHLERLSAESGLGRDPALSQKLLAMAAKIKSVADKASRVVALVQNDPSDINQARRFFVTYLDQVAQVTDKYHSYADQAREAGQIRRLNELSGAYLRVLETIEAACVEQIERLQAHDLMDLEVQIEVLQTQLDREGLV